MLGARVFTLLLIARYPRDPWQIAIFYAGAPVLIWCIALKLCGIDEDYYKGKPLPMDGF